MIDLSDLARPPFPIAATDAAVEDAKAFVLAKWQDRHDAQAREWERAMGSPWTRERPVDLSSSCKFTSLFAAVVFGGVLKGNYGHQFVEAGGATIDLNEDASDVRGVDEVYGHDPAFFGSPDHVDSMRSCLPRVREWLAEYAGRVMSMPPGPGL